MRTNRLAAVLLLAAVVVRSDAAEVVPPPEAMVVQGVPPIPGAVAEEVRRYTEARAAGLADWHPTKREMLIATRFANTPQVHRLRMPLGARSQITFFEEPVFAAAYGPDGEYFLFSRDAGGNEFGQLYRFDLADGKATLLTDGGRSQNGGVRWRDDRRMIAYGSTRRNGADRDIYVMDPRDPRGDRKLVEVKGGGWGVTDWSPDGKRLLVGEYVSVTESYLWMADVDSGRMSPITGRGGETTAYGAGIFTPDGNAIYATSDAGSEFQRLVRMNLDGTTAAVLTDDIPWDVDDVELSPDGKRLAFVVNEAGVARLYLLDLATNQRRKVEGIPVGTMGGLHWHRNGREIGFSAGSAKTTGDVYSVDADTLAVTRWTESELGGIPAEGLADAELIKWKSFDDREITGFLYRPPAAKFPGKRPVIVDIHGGPEGQARPRFLGRNNYYLQELGVAFILPNVRGSSGYGKTFVSLDNGMKREDSVKDVGALFDWIGKQPDLDASRVMVTGASYGGYMSLAIATTYPERIRCAVDIVGISNFNTFLKNTESYRRDLRRVEYGDERDPKMAEFFERISPANRVERIKRPMMIVQGGNDPRVPLGESEQMVAKMKGRGVPVWYLMAKDEGHGFAKKRNADYQFYATVMFVKQNLLGDPAQ